MYRLVFSLIFIFLASLVLAQNEFQPGYVVKNGQRIDCLIKNEGWFRAPEVISYKFENQDKINMAPANEFDGFYIEDTKYKYVSRHFQPLYNKPGTDMYLLVLVEGKASLYQFNSASGEKYYYEAEDGKLKELDYKSKIEGSKLREEFGFRGQIFQDLECEDITKSMLQSLEYQKKKLVNVFNTYNECSNAEYTDYTKFKNKGDVNLYLMAGTSLLTTSTSAKGNETEVSAPSNIPLMGALEIEYTLPISNNKFSVFTGVSYSQNKVEGTLKSKVMMPSTGLYLTNNYDYDVAYDLLSIPVGVRLSMFVNPNHSFYINPGFTYNFIMSEEEFNFSHFDNNETKNSSYLDHGIGFFAGIGYRFKSKFGAEIRYTPANVVYIRDLKPSSNAVVVMLSYKVF